jgi:predicted transcriptional regulator
LDINLNGNRKKRTRRSKIDITVAILKITKSGANKTRIVYGANLNFVLAGKYLDFLKKNGFIESTTRKTHYQITDKGREFLDKIQEVMIK